jgi:hypothetical protein
VILHVSFSLLCGHPRVYRLQFVPVTCLVRHMVGHFPTTVLPFTPQTTTTFLGPASLGQCDLHQTPQGSITIALNFNKHFTGTTNIFSSSRFIDFGGHLSSIQQRLLLPIILRPFQEPGLNPITIFFPHSQYQLDHHDKPPEISEPSSLTW